MKIRLLIGLICAVILFAPAFYIVKAIVPDYEIKTVYESEDLVYITTYGEKYHSVYCEHLKSSSHPIGRNQAISEGYVACKVCKGRSYEDIMVAHEQQVPMDDTTKSLLISVSITLFLSIVISLRLSAKIDDRLYEKVQKDNNFDE